MTTPSMDPICVRNSLLQHILLGKRKLFDGERDQRQLTKDGLIDAMLVLYDECSTDLTKKDETTVSFVDKYHPVITKLRKLRVNAADFEQKKVIGRGHFGEVYLVKEKQTGDVYAMKIMKKKDILAKQNIAFYEEEKDIMAKASSDWLTALHCSFQDHENLYLVMEFHPGGDLLSLLNRRDGTLSEDEAKFYLAELVMALHTLHSMGYVHRDIKPENVLLDRLGHIKLADFGSAAKLDSTALVRSEMAVGTAEYIAPEVLTSMNNVGLLAGGYGVECDFWSLGVMAYEMVFGETPFAAEKMTTVYGNIMNFKNSLKFSDTTSISAEFRNLISGLLCDSKSRLGYQQLISHPFFASIDWNSLREKSPPYVPVINSMDDTSNFEDFESEGLVSHSTINLRNTQSAITRDLPFIGFSHVKENGFNFQFDTNAANEQTRRIKELEQELNMKTREIVELKKYKFQYEQEKGDVSSVERLQQKIKRIETERDNLEKLLHQAQREANHHRRLLEMEHCERAKNDAKVVEMIKDVKEKWEKTSEKERSEFKREIQLWKQYHAESQRKVDEYADLLKEAMKTTTKLEDDCNYWKARASKYKELSVRGQRVEEKRASVSFGPINEQLIQTQQQLEKERILKADLKTKIEYLEDCLRDSRANFAIQLEEKEKQWVITSTERETDYQHKIRDLEEKVLRQKENRIKELEARLDTQMNECQALRDHADQLQKSLDSTLQWRTSFETSFSVREGELETRIKQLEGELRAATDIRIELQKQVSEVTQREAIIVQKFEATVIDMREAVDRLEKKNQELNLQLSASTSSNTITAASMNAQEADELKQRIVFLEEQIGKLEQQLEKAREQLTLEREKARQTQTDLWKKEKELSDAKIDLRIANRETKTSETENAKIKEELKLLNEKIKEKDALVETLHSEVSKLRLDINEAQRSLFEKEKDLIDANKAAQTSRELKRELQFVKDEFAICQRLKSTLESEAQRYEERAIRQTDEKKELQQRLDEKIRHLQDKENELRLLKDTMATMDEQLQEFECLVEGSDKKQEEFESEKSKLNQEIEKLKQEIRSAKAQANEEKSLKLFSESKLRDVESRLKSCETENDSRVGSLKKQVEELTAANAELNERINQIELQLSEAEATVSSLSRKCNVLEEDNIKLQEESSALRTQLFSVKSSNAVLGEGLEEAISKAEDYKARISQLETQIETTRVMHKERELKYDSTIAQQTKLIDFLQSKTEQPKKKSTFTDKLFGSHKKENQPSYHMGFRELEANLEKKTAQCRNLTEQLNKCKAELSALKESSSTQRTATLLKTPIADVHTRCQTATPLPNRALSRLTQSPGTQCSPTNSSIRLASQRMHHNIPHRLQSQMVMRATNCAVCLDSVHFGRQVSVCQDCNASAHFKCAPHLPSTCGLPMGLAEHFGSVVTQEPANRTGDSSAPSTFLMKGWIKVQRPGKVTCWDRKYMKLNDNKICIYDHEPSSDLMEPIDTFDLQPTDGSTVAIHSAVAQSEVLSTAKTDVPYIFMIESIPRTTCWPGRSLCVMALNFHEKKAWVDALEKVTKVDSKRNSSTDTHKKPKIVLSLDEPIDANCTVTISDGIMLIGAKEGLFSYRLQKNNKQLVKIEGVTNVQQIVVVPKLSAVMMIVGEERHLVMTELRVLQGCAEAIQSAQPTIAVEVVPNCDDIHLFEVSNLTSKDEIFLCAATHERVKLFKWNVNSSAFILRKELIVSETCSCIHFTEHSVLVGCDRFYEVDLGNFTAEEFLDASDSSLAYVVFGLKQAHSFPVAIFDVTMRRGDTEFLLCYHEFGVFVDGYGRRSRPEDVKWTRLPLGFVYRKPYLCVLHFDSVEVMRLTSTSFKTKSDSSRESLSSADSVIPLPSVFIEMRHPTYLGPGPDAGSNYFFSNKGETMDIVQLDAALALGEKDPNHPVHPDDVSSITGSELSLSRILDQSDDSGSTAPDVSPFKRAQGGQETVRESKRVKFESDL